MTDLDETDLEILRLLAEDARRPWSDIAESVGLSPPAVSDRVSRLREAGVVRGFTVDVDRSLLREGVPVLVELSVGGGGSDVEAVRESLRAADAVEHLFTTAEGRLVFHARVPDGAVREWLHDTVEPAAVESLSVTLLSDVEWTPSVEGTSFALSCAECGNTVTSEGVVTTVGGDRYRFCCPSCESRFRERYDRIESEA